MKKRILTVLLAVLVILCVPVLAEEGTEDPVLQELAGTWEGTGNPAGGGNPIQLSIILNPDGTGSYTFEQGGYVESYPITVGHADGTFEADIPKDNLLGITSCGGTYELEGEILHLSIETGFGSGRVFRYSAECTRTAGAEPGETEETPERDPVLAAVLDALGEGPWESTLAALEDGEVLERNTRSDTVLGLQKTLNAFGQQLTLENRMNSRTIKALNAVQTAFGLDVTEKLDADGYAQLLVRLLAYQDDEAADGILRGSMYTEGGNEYDYIRGCVLVMQEKYYSARECFEESHFGDWEKRAQACVQKWPKNGQLYKDSRIKGGGMELTVSVNARDRNSAMYVKIYLEDGTLASTLFIGGTGKAKTKLPGGVYVIKDGTGTDWYGPEEAFGKYGSYETMTFDDRGTAEVELKSGHAYTITVNVQTLDPDAAGVGSEWESWGGF